MPQKIIAIAGAHGFIGGALCEMLGAAGYEIRRLVRKPGHPRDIFYDYESGKIEADKLAGCFGVINLAGKNIMSMPLTKTIVQEIYDSRIKSTALIAKTIADLDDGPRVFLCASAVGYYGDSAAKRLTETAPAGRSSLARLCQDWEQACEPARRAGIRVINMRFAPVLHKDGGLLKKLLPIFKLGLGGHQGSGEQFMPIIALEDLGRAVIFLLTHAEISGPVNFATPTTITNAQFAKELAYALKRPALLHAPAPAIKLLMGDSSHLVLDSYRAYPQALLAAGFSFKYRSAGDFLAAMGNLG